MLDSKIGQDMLAKFPSRGIIALAWGEQGFRHLTNNVRPVKTPADAKGLKIRTTENPIHIAAFRQIGILPTPMAWPEVATALQQGTIDGQENPLSVITSAKLSQMQKHLALTGHVYGPALVLMSANVYEACRPPAPTCRSPKCRSRRAATGCDTATRHRAPSRPRRPPACPAWFAPIASGTPFIMRLLCAFDRLLFKLVSVIAQLLLVAAAAAFYQVIARFVLHAPADWSEVLTRAPAHLDRAAGRGPWPSATAP